MFQRFAELMAFWPKKLIKKNNIFEILIISFLQFKINRKGTQKMIYINFKLAQSYTVYNEYNM